LEYVEARALPDLTRIDALDGDVLVAAAARVGTTRLIDNVTLTIHGDDVRADLGARVDRNPRAPREQLGTGSGSKEWA
jgi:hypothetical protein